MALEKKHACYATGTSLLWSLRVLQHSTELRTRCQPKAPSHPR